MENIKITSTSTDQIHKSTVEIYNDTYADARKELDYTYHSHYTKDRQILQDKIITELLSVGRVMDRPWLVYSAGAMGAGKSYTIRKFSEMNLFPLLAFVIIDPDRIKCMLPEMKKFIEHDPDTAGTRVHKESSLIAEIAERQAIRMNKCLLVDGSLRDTKWYEQRLDNVSREHVNYYFAIIHVIAPSELVYERVKKRTVETGRNVPLILIEKSIEEVPQSVEILSHYVHFTVTINNDKEEIPRIVEPNLRMLDGHKNKWFRDKFKNVWEFLDKNKKNEDISELKNRINNFGSNGCSLSMGGGYYGKYLKYKAKYLELKSKI
jgi:predicted ABC-type ATPase